MLTTNYGDLPIEIDPKTGNARVVQGGVDTGDTQARRRGAVQRATGGGSEHGAGSNPAPAPTYKSKLEARFALYLDCLKHEGAIKSYRYAPFSVQIAPKKKYTPDFAIESQDGQVTIVELKGSKHQKNYRDSVTRCHVAAANLPMFRWQIVERVKGSWKVTEL